MLVQRTPRPAGRTVEIAKRGVYKQFTRTVVEVEQTHTPEQVTAVLMRLIRKGEEIRSRPANADEAPDEDAAAAEAAELELAEALERAAEAKRKVQQLKKRRKS